MQTLQHTMAHRGAGAPRTNARWHPYTPPRSSGANTPNYVPLRCSSSQQIPSSSDCNQYLITPASTVYSISPACSTFAISPPRSSSSSQIPSLKPINNQAPHVPKPQPAKTNYVASLVDQAVRSLTDIWRPEVIPTVFATSTRVSVAKQSNSHPAVTSHRQTITRRHSLQLPSPCSPTTQMSPLPPVSEAPRSSATSALASQYLGEQYNNATIVSEKDLVPIRTFVHEVLRRSRTTCSVLQSAICYIEAIRRKVPELAEAEIEGKGVKGEPELGERITKMEDVSEDALDFLTSPSSSDATITNGLQTELMPTADSFDTNIVPTILQSGAIFASRNAPIPEADAVDPLKRRKIPAKPLPPLPALPSPLLCPRRAFLAALILASKFLQDRCYSNRAWAKLSGLPPREVGRCERALGEALEWRLWVGKGSGVAEDSRSVARSKSESAITFGGAAVPKGVSQTPSPPLSDAGVSPEFGRQSAFAKSGITRNLQSLRRAATLPDDLAFRSVPPKYRAPGSLPFAFNVGQTAAAGEPALVSFGTMASSLSRTSHTSFFGADESASRWSYSPESLLDTPLTQHGNVWSPAPSTSSTDSSDSGSSVGSVATPPNMHTPYASGRATYSLPFADNSMSEFKNVCTKGIMAHGGVTTNVAPITSWYADVVSAGVVAPITAQEFGQLSMLDSLNSDFCNQR